MITSIFYTVFYEPLLNGLIWLINFMPSHDIGAAIISLTLIVRFIIFPFTHKSVITQIKIKRLEPEIKEIKEKFKKDNQEQAKKIMELYKSHGINPFSGFVTLIIQIPIIFALYKVFLGGINFDQSHIYSFINIPDFVSVKFLGLFDLTQKSYIWAAITGATQFFQLKLAIPPVKKSAKPESFKEELVKNMSMQMKYVMPVFIFFVVSRFASAIAVYWTTMNIFAIVHETIVRNKAKKLDGKTNTNNKIIAGNNA